MAKITVKVDELNARAMQMLIAAGVSEQDAKTVVNSLQEAEICGPESHGYVRLRSYLDRIEKGLIRVPADIRIEAVTDTMLRVDAGNGLGQIVTTRVMEECMERAKEHGVCTAFIKNSNHFGTCGYYSRMAARRGYVAMVLSNASSSMPPFGGIDNILGTNPYAVSFPAGKYDNFTLDIALTAAAKGKIRIYEKMGKEIPLGWAMDADGNDTTDPAKAIAGGMLPMGGHKGYGLAMMVDLFCGIMSGAKISQEIESMFNATQPAGVGHFLLVMDPSHLLPMEVFVARVEQWFDDIKASRVRNGFQEILIPGELENRKAKDHPQEIQLLDKTAADMGLIEREE